jgi:hypothetical protein
MTAIPFSVMKTLDNAIIIVMFCLVSFTVLHP